MKRTLLLASIALCAAGYMQAQSVRFVQNGEIIENDANIRLYEYDEIMGQMEWAPTLRNMTDHDVNIVIQTSIISNEDNSFLALCVGGSCYAPTATETSVITVPAGGETTDFHTQFIPNGETSKAIAYYILMNVDDDTSEDFQAVSVTYDYPAYLSGEIGETKQSVQFVQNGEVIENDANIRLYEYDEIMGLMEWAPTLRNMTDHDVNIVIQTSVISNEDNSFLALCVGSSCYAPTATETSVITVPAGGETTDFHTQFLPNSDTSKAIAQYTIININDETGYDRQTVTVTYDYPAYLSGETESTPAFECNFSDALEGFTTYDIDGRTPTSAAQQYGFAPGIAWQVIEINRNPAAVSNSSYTPIGLAEDWLITPAIVVGEGQTLTFKSQTYSLSTSTKIGKLNVLVSTTGVETADFTDVLAENLSIRSNVAKYSYDLSAYAGQTIYIAFVNVSMAKDFLIVDDIFVGIPPVAEIALSYERLQDNASTGQRLSGTVTAGGATTITEYTATLTCGDFSTSRTYEGLNVEPNATHTFIFNESLPAPTPGEPQNFTVSVTVNQGETIQEEGCILTQAYQPTKRVVVEELTGTWCGFCVRGIYYMEQMNENYPDNFIGIAVHGGDPMQVNSYMNYLSSYTTSYPFCMAMRDTGTEGDPQSMPTFYNTHINKPGWADVSIYAEWADEGKTTLHTQTSTTFATSSNDIGMQLALVIIENDVNRPGDSNYDQSNYYSSGSYGPMGGYENLPSTIPAAQMYYQKVARAIYDNVQTGIKGSIPKEVQCGVTYQYNRELELPENVFVPDNCQVIALLIDIETGEIVNAAQCDVNYHNSTIIKGDANGSMTVDVADVVTEISYLTGQEPQPFIYEAADVNNDLVINILDVVGTINIILTPHTTTAAQIASMEQSATYSISGDTLYLDSPIALGGIQCMIKTANSETVTTLANFAGFESVCSTVDGGYIYLTYSLEGDCIPAGKHALLKLGGATVDEVILSDPRGNNIVAIDGGVSGLGAIKQAQMRLPAPNPFGHEVSIAYMIGSEGSHDTRIVITNISGCIVTEHSSHESYGQHSYTWQPEESLPQGIYLATLYVDGVKIQTAKLIYMK